MAKISHWPAAIITQNIRWFKNLLTFQKLLENAIYSFPEAGSDGKHHSNSDMWEMLLVTLNNEAHGCTKHTKWTNIHAEDGNLNTSHLIAIFQDLINCTYKRYSCFYLVMISFVLHQKRWKMLFFFQCEMLESHLGSTVHCVRWKHLWWIRGRQWNVETECGIIIENVCLNKDYHNYDCLNILSPYKNIDIFQMCNTLDM